MNILKIIDIILIIALLSFGMDTIIRVKKSEGKK